MVPMMGNTPSMSPAIFTRDENVGIAYGMGLTAEKVAAAVEGERARTRTRSRWRRTRRPCAGPCRPGSLRDEITPIEVTDRSSRPRQLVRSASRPVLSRLDEGPRPDTSLEGLAKLRPGVRQQGRRSRPATARRRPTAPAR